jgi:hypothetical protein
MSADISRFLDVEAKVDDEYEDAFESDEDDYGVFTLWL